MKHALAMLGLAVGLCACTDNTSKVSGELAAYGFTNVETQGYDAFVCGKDDNFATKFTATNPQGNKVAGVLCSGLMKGSTVRNLHVLGR